MKSVLLFPKDSVQYDSLVQLLNSVSSQYDGTPIIGRIEAQRVQGLLLKAAKSQFSNNGRWRAAKALLNEINIITDYHAGFKLIVKNGDELYRGVNYSIRDTMNFYVVVIE